MCTFRWGPTRCVRRRTCASTSSRATTSTAPWRRRRTALPPRPATPATPNLAAWTDRQKPPKCPNPRPKRPPKKSTSSETPPYSISHHFHSISVFFFFISLIYFFIKKNLQESISTCRWMNELKIQQYNHQWIELINLNWR